MPRAWGATRVGGGAGQVDGLLPLFSSLMAEAQRGSVTNVAGDERATKMFHRMRIARKIIVIMSC